MAMKYGLAKRVNFYNIDTHEGAEVVATTGDYARAEMWMKKNVKDMEGELRDIVFPYAWAYFARCS